MKDPYPPRQLTKYTEADNLWAREAVKDVLIGCILNQRLVDSGVCNKYLIDMTDDELVVYTKFINEILEGKR